MTDLIVTSGSVHKRHFSNRHRFFSQYVWEFDELSRVVAKLLVPLFAPRGVIHLAVDGKRVAYAARKGEKQLVVVDGQEGPEYDGIHRNGPSFHGDGSLEFLAVQDGVICRVVIGP